MYLLQSLQCHLSVSRVFIFSISSDFAFLVSQGAISHIFGAREDMLSVPKYNMKFLRLCIIESFLRSYGFCTKWKICFIISRPKSFFFYKFLSLRFADLFGESYWFFLLICFVFADKSSSFFVNFINSVVLSPAMRHSNKKAVRKQMLWKHLWEYVFFLFM